MVHTIPGHERFDCGPIDQESMPLDKHGRTWKWWWETASSFLLTPSRAAGRAIFHASEVSSGLFRQGCPTNPLTATGLWHENCQLFVALTLRPLAKLQQWRTRPNKVNRTATAAETTTTTKAMAAAAGLHSGDGLKVHAITNHAVVSLRPTKTLYLQR